MHLVKFPGTGHYGRLTNRRTGLSISRLARGIALPAIKTLALPIKIWILKGKSLPQIKWPGVLRANSVAISGVLPR